MDDIILRVQEPDAVTLQYVEAKLKPEVVGHATPTEEAQTVTPAPGTTFSAVELDAIPPEYVVPSGTLDITENAEDINVREKAAVNVNVQPNLQTPDPITPTKAQQTITPDAGYDGLDEVVVEPIPDEYIVPSGALNITENANGINVTDKATVNVAVPVPVMPDEYAIGGSVVGGTATGYYIKRGTTQIKNDAFKNASNLEFVDIPDTVESIGNNAFFGLSALDTIRLPNNLETIGISAFANCSNLKLANGLPASLISLGNGAFQRCGNIQFDSFPMSITSLGTYSFYGCHALRVQNLPNVSTIPSNCFGDAGVIIDEIPNSVLVLDVYCFYSCKKLTSMTFKGTPNSIAANSFVQCTNLLDIYVPWSEGEIANAPWGATNATIHYDYTGGGA